MNTPSVTPAQILAIVKAVLGLLVAIAVLDDPMSQAIMGVAATVVPVALLLVDASIRKSRAQNAAEIVRAKAVDAAAKARAETAPAGVPAADPAT